MYLREKGRWVPLLCLVEPYNGLNACVFLSLAYIAGASSAKRGERGIFKTTCETCAKREKREEKNKALVTSPLLWLFRPPTPTSID